MVAESMLIQEAIDGHWVPSALPHLQTYDRHGWRLCLNPDVPAWIITTEAASCMLKFVDGHRTVDQIAEIIRAHDIHVDREYVRCFFEQARDRKLFAPPAESEEATPWKRRRLTAMHLHLTDRCNLQCSYCLRNSTPHIPIRYEEQRFQKMLEYIQPFSIPNLRVTYAGGEPLTYPGFEQVVERSSALGYDNELLTNGILITEKRASFIGRHFNKVRISLDGPDEVTHAATRGNNFSQVLRGIRFMAEQDVDLTVQVTVTKANQQAASTHMRSLLPEGVHVAYTPLLPLGRGSDCHDDFINDHDFLVVSRAATINKGERVASEYNSGFATFSPCHAGFSNLSIADSGDVYPCHLFHSEPFHFGNIFHENFEDIFFGDKICNYVRSMDVRNNNPECAACEMRLLCAGGCKANTLHASGSHRGRDLYCSFIKNAIIDNIFDSSELGIKGELSQAFISHDTAAVEALG